jgi:ribosomal protein S18 acetylase RimI-like enzyme
MQNNNNRNYLTDSPDYPKVFHGKNNIPVVVRPMVNGDLEKSHEFFCRLPEELRKYLRIDVTDIEILRKRMNGKDRVKYWRLVGEHNGKIIADATLYQNTHGWMRHTAEFRCIVSPEYQKIGLGHFLLKELTRIANDQKVEIAYSEVMAEQEQAKKILDSLGFVKELRRKSHVKDIYGKLHDQWIYTNNLSVVRQKLESYMFQAEFQTRGFESE